MSTVVLIIQWLSIVVLAVESIYIFTQWKTKMQSYLCLFCIVVLVNNVAYALELSSTTVDAMYLTARLSYVGKVWIPLVFFAMITQICQFRVDKRIFIVLVSIQTAIMNS